MSDHGSEQAINKFCYNRNLHKFHFFYRKGILKIFVLLAQESPATLILSVTSRLLIMCAHHIYNREVQNRKLKIWSSTKNNKNAKNVSIMHNSLSHEIEASITWKIGNITFCRRCLGIAFEKICCDLST